MPLEQLAAAKIELHPSLQLVMADQPIFSIWQTNQEQCEDEQEAQKIDLDESQQVLIVRPAYTLSMYNIDLCTYQLIDSLGKGYQLQKAIEINKSNSEKRHKKKALRERTRRLEAGEQLESDCLEVVKEVNDPEQQTQSSSDDDDNEEEDDKLFNMPTIVNTVEQKRDL